MISGWWEASLSTLLSNYDLKDNYNGDEFGLFCECLQGKPIKLLMLVIAKVRKSRGFKNVKFLPCSHRNQRKCWMDGV